MNAEPRYTLAMRVLHWLVFLAALIAVAAIEILDVFPKGSLARAALFEIHQSAGLSVFALMLLRLLARLMTPVPSPVPGPNLLRRIGGLTHGILYLLMFVMPVLGVLAVAWSAEPIRAFGMTLPSFLAEHDKLAHLAGDVHESGATLVYIFVGLHATAALWHAFVMKDGVLRRMW
ncbi:cytochrome b561 [Ralstonia sp. 25mfcol4.1]|uniref:cytochrome b n=1 Tax=Ralstonia sp. 25mfcol4.1 TaxID=1761899 RepID=UPI00088A3D00|nr:cytochrome b [Ralstonia sp. 25mfcol4.1]SDP77923.1 cytochrome b561 [Ralstonia sp. 25mfcol4.1]